MAFQGLIYFLTPKKERECGGNQAQWLTVDVLNHRLGRTFLSVPAELHKVPKGTNVIRQSSTRLASGLKNLWFWLRRVRYLQARIHHEVFLCSAVLFGGVTRGSIYQERWSCIAMKKELGSQLQASPFCLPWTDQTLYKGFLWDTLYTYRWRFYAYDLIHAWSAKKKLFLQFWSMLIALSFMDFQKCRYHISVRKRLGINIRKVAFCYCPLNSFLSSSFQVAMEFWAES